jgi:CRP/FNR family transcriptional regulator, cyclic AMP receptor protein
VSVDVFEGLDERELERLERACAVTRYAAGHLVFDEGDPGDDLFIVRSGRVRIAKAISPAVDRTLAVVERGGVFGELALVGSTARSRRPRCWRWRASGSSR